MNTIAISFLKELKTNLNLSIPLLLTSLLQGMSGFIGIMFLAYCGSDVLAASGIVNEIFLMLITIYWGTISAVSVLVAQSAGAKNNYQINLALGQGLYLAFCIAIPSWLAVWGIDHLLYLTNQSAHIITLASQFLFATTLSLLPLAILIVFEQFLIGLSKTRLVLIINLIQIPFEIILYYVLIFGKFDFILCYF